MLSEFIDKKFAEIEDYIESNRSRIKDDKKLLEAVSKRIKFWVEIASLILYNDPTIGEFQSLLIDGGMDGSITIKLNNLKQKLKLVPSGMEVKKDDDTISIGTDKVTSLRGIIDLFDGKIVGVE